jgi:hypothetical protein
LRHSQNYQFFFPDWAKGNEAGMKAWMYGRMLAAANNMGSTRNAKEAVVGRVSLSTPLALGGHIADMHAQRSESSSPSNSLSGCFFRL